MRGGPFGEGLRIKAKYFPEDRIAIVYGDRRITWKELNSRVNRLAQGLLKLGIRKGTKCGIMMYNKPEFIESNLALQKLGAIPSSDQLEIYLQGAELCAG